MSSPTRARRLRLALPAHRREELVHIRDRARQAGGLAVATGVCTGLAVAGFDRLVAADLFEAVAAAPLWVQALTPGVALLLGVVVMRFAARGGSPGLSDEYIKAFHEPGRDLDPRLAPGSLVASAATLGGGAAMGFEGPSIYIGAVVGSWLQRRFHRFIAPGDAKVLLVCGAAAGVAAIFKSPATGVVFALEVPYRQDLARRMLLPAMFSAAASYVVFAAINGTEPLFPVSGAPPFDLRDIGGAVILGLLAGALARFFCVALKRAKRLAVKPELVWLRAVTVAAVIAAVFVACRIATGESLTLGSGYSAIRWSLEPDHSLAVILVVFLLRALATLLAVSGGGVGGLFIPLVVQGALLGSAVGGFVDSTNHTLFPVLGVTAFLGAGYRVPLAAVMFVAEATGRAGFIVPGLIAAACSQLFMGAASASSYQRDTRAPADGMFVSGDA